MEIPASIAGKIVELKVKLGDKVSEGSVLALIEAAGAAQAAPAGSARSESREISSGAPSSAGAAVAQMAEAAKVIESMSAPPPTSIGPAHVSPIDDGHVVKPHASPAVRMFARELGVDLTKVRGTGPKQRITMEDVRGYVKGVIASSNAPAAAGDGAALGLIPWPKVDFAKFGPIEPKPLSRIKKLSGANLHRNWVMIPHVTNNDEADITDLEAFRVSLNKESDQTGVKFTMLGFLIKAVVAALKKHPEFNASLDGDQLVYKHYYHIGFAADTPNGLVVPVLKDADKKGLSEIAKETSELAKKARDGKLSPADMQGGTFSISSLGGIGGTHFTPIINAPEVAILGVSKSYYKPVWNGKEFVPQLTLPLSLSYDHRVIDGAAAARFNNVLRSLLGDFRRAVL
ncbi:MAG: dihydrolipoyllysine-residue acetyltransferase, partial [Betaproteobacteria bacterium]|nr:dihydrolipoyllysine-residue acetyltransferase [Betaproteobacteria bacterium]